MVPQVIEAVAPLRERLAAARAAGGDIGFVPTMGALHAGHASLIARARRECQTVAVSIFVNPLQFDRPDDLDRYPRTLDADLDACLSLGVDVVFAPSAREMYPQPVACVVDVGQLADHLCGRYRPGHFRGVATVVLKLFNILRADRAYFGEKDAQQLAIVRRLVRDLNVPTTIVGVPTVREPDGLAMSSRNRHLSPAERNSATALYRVLREAERRIEAGGRDPATVLREAAATIPAGSNARLEYLAIVDAQELQPVERIEGQVLIAGAAWVGATRLIDNIGVTVS